MAFIEGQGSRPVEEGRELGKDLYRLASLPLVKEQLVLGTGTWLARPAGLPLDVAFLHSDTATKSIEEMSFLGLELFGKEDVIGIHVRRTSGTVANGLKILDGNPHTAELSRIGARAVVLTPSQLRSWVDFYDDVYKSGLVEKIGRRALSFSGLEWFPQKEKEEMSNGLSEVIINNWDYLKSMGVDDFRVLGGVSLAFVDKDNRPMTVPVFHFRDWKMERNIMVEKVIPKVDNCAGLVVREVGETKREFNDRAERAREEIQQYFDYPVEVARVSLGQTSLWRKMGFGSEWSSVDPEAGSLVEDVVKFLYLGESNMEPGFLAQSPWRLSLPGRGGVYSYPGLDLVFMSRVGGKRKVTTVDNLLVWDKQGREVSLSNVAAIRMFPSGSSFEQMKEAIDPIRKEFLHRAGLPGAYVLNMTPELLELWKSYGSPFFDESHKDVVSGLSLKKRHEYFAPVKMEKGWFFQFRQKEEIGGNKNGIILTDAAGNQVTHLWDVGLGFSDMPKGMSGIGKDPNTADGLLRLFRLGVLPMKPGWWSSEYLMQTAIKMTGLSDAGFIKRDVVAQYMVAELIGRVSDNDLRRKLSDDVYRAVVRYGPEYREKMWGDREYLVESASPTHPHADHINLLSYLDPSIRVVGSGPTVGFLEALSNKAGSWRRRFVDRKLLTEPKNGRAYQTEEVDLQTYFFSDRPVRLSPQVTMTPYFVPHSVPAVWQMYDVRFNGGGSMIFNSGDWRVDGSNRVFDVASKLAGKPDLIVMEATNFDNEKVGMGHSEEEVKRTLKNWVTERSNDLIVTVAPINNLARLKKILEVAESTGRNVALSYAHAEIALTLAAAKEFAPAGAEGFEDVLPYDLGNGRLTVWAKQMTNPRAYHKALYSIASRGDLGVLTHDRLGKENNKWIVVVSPFDVLQDQFDGLNIKDHMDIMWMSSFPYDREQKLFIGANRSWMNSNGRVRFVADMEVKGQGGLVKPLPNQSGILHVSGHASPEEMVKVVDLLVGNSRKNVPVIINHSENPEMAARFVRERLGDRVKIIWQMDRYDPTDPQNKRGFYYPL